MNRLRNGLAVMSLPQRFALIGGIVLLIAAGALAYVNQAVSIAQLKNMAEANNVALTTALANVLRDEVDRLIETAPEIDGDTPHENRALGQVGRAVAEAVRGTRIVKVKIYSPSGLTVYSSDPRQIGEDKSANQGFLAAMDRRVVSTLTYRDRMDSFEQTVFERDLISSYIPVFAPDALETPSGVFEIYSDVTALRGAITERVWLILGATLGILAIVYGVVLATVIRGNRLISRTHGENLNLQLELAEQRRAEEIAQVALSSEREMSEIRANFVAAASHEFRTPLAIIQACADILDHYSERLDRNEVALNLAEIKRQVSAVTLVLDRILIGSQVGANRLECHPAEMELAPFCRALVEQMRVATDSRQRFNLDIAEDIGRVALDERLLRHILNNLLSNAIKYSPPDGTIDIAVARDGEVVRFRVRDDGEGIAAEEIEQVFELYFRGEKTSGLAGTGLGLSIVKNAAEVHGGNVRVSSPPGRGAEFTVTIPL
jgi:signal transduction histidine kinase